jgi:maltose O-acetyltransferase
MGKGRFFLGKLIKYPLLFVKALIIKIFYFGTIRLRSLFIGIELTARLKPIGPRAHMTIGKRFYVRKYSDIECRGGEIVIGDRVFINKNCTIVAVEKISIGNDCMFGEDVSIYDHDHSFDLNGVPFRNQGVKSRPITIGNNVWVGCKVFIGKGVNIGDNVVIAAGSIVTMDIPSDSIYFNSGIKPLRTAR